MLRIFGVPKIHAEFFRTSLTNISARRSLLCNTLTPRLFIAINPKRKLVARQFSPRLDVVEDRIKNVVRLFNLRNYFFFPAIPSIFFSSLAISALISL